MKPETAQTLTAAARQIEAVSKQLDRREQPCDHCGTNRKANWNEWQMAQELDAITRKLRNFAKKLAAPTDESVPLDQWLAWGSKHNFKPAIRRADEPRIAGHTSRPATEAEVAAELERRKAQH